MKKRRLTSDCKSLTERMRLPRFLDVSMHANSPAGSEAAAAAGGGEGGEDAGWWCGYAMAEVKRADGTGCS